MYSILRDPFYLAAAFTGGANLPRVPCVIVRHLPAALIFEIPLLLILLVVFFHVPVGGFLG